LKWKSHQIAVSASRARKGKGLESPPTQNKDRKTRRATELAGIITFQANVNEIAHIVSALTKIIRKSAEIARGVTAATTEARHTIKHLVLRLESIEKGDALTMETFELAPAA
jgi:uncharacterized protein with PhoU and TrkA domain